jgi:basic membrane protein A and related proteins
VDLRRSVWVSTSVLVLLITSCGGGDPAGEGAEQGCGAATGDEISVGLAYDIGGENDKSFNDAAKRGVDNAIADGLVDEANVTKIEANSTGSNRDDNVVNLAEQGCDVVFAVGYAFSEGIDTTAKEFPNVKFAVVDGYSQDADNVTNLVFKEEEGSYLVGAAAAMKSEAGVIGFLGGQSGTGLIEKFQAGYEAGAKAIDPDIEILVEYIGSDTAAYFDATKGEALSAKMYDGGADVIFHAAGQSGLGLFKAAVEANAWAIGVDSDQSLTASEEQQELILTSMLKRVDTAIYDTIKEISEGNFTTGYQVFELAEDGIDYAVNEFNDNEELLSSEIQAQLEKFKQDILDGKIKIPTKPQS